MSLMKSEQSEFTDVHAAIGWAEKVVAAMDALGCEHFEVSKRDGDDDIDVRRMFGAEKVLVEILDPNAQRDRTKRRYEVPIFLLRGEQA